jgi:3-hydroxybutyryl-CoA dehydrogenase
MPANLDNLARAKRDFSPARITILGAGLMGTALAIEHARFGLKVTLFDVDQGKLENASVSIKKILNILADSSEINQKDSEKFLDAITLEQNVEAALTDTPFILEAITEKRDLKKDLYSLIDKTAPLEALICSNTSYLNIFELIPDRRLGNCLITHWYTPPYIIDLIDIVPSNPGYMPLAESVAAFYREKGKHPIVFKKFIAGYIANRLQSALNLEAFHLMESEGISALEIDESIQHGLALRLLLLGQMKKADFTGLEMVRNGLATGAYKPTDPKGSSKILEGLLAQGNTGVPSGKGFYDYGGKSPEEIYEMRDRELIDLKRVTNRFLDERKI